MRAAIYARVSSAAQRDAHTIESQLHSLCPFVQRQQWTLVDTYIDDGRSAKTGKLDLRDGFARLLVDAHARKFDVLVTAAVDRLTRTEDLIELAAILGPLQRANVRIVSPSLGEMDLNTMHGQMSALFQAQAAAQENVRRAERVKSGRIRAIAENRNPGSVVPHGLLYSRESKQWSINEPAAETVRDIFARVIRGQSLRAIAVDLNDLGVPPPREIWGRHNIWLMVRSRAAVGEWLADKQRRLVVKVPPLVSEEIWNAAQESLIAHGKRGLNKTRHTYLLEGLAVCGGCGGPIGIRSAQRGRVAKYTCRNRGLAKSTALRCATSQILRVSDIDERVWERVAMVLTDPDLADAIERRTRELRADAANWKSDAASWTKRLAKLDQHETALLARFRRDQIGETALDAELAAVARERSALRAQIKTSESATTAASSDAVSVERLAGELRDLGESATLDEKRQVIRGLVGQGGAVVDGERVRLTLRVDLRPMAPLASRSGCSSGHEGAVSEVLRIRVVA